MKWVKKPLQASDHASLRWDRTRNVSHLQSIIANDDDEFQRYVEATAKYGHTPTGLKFNHYTNADFKFNHYTNADFIKWLNGINKKAAIKLLVVLQQDTPTQIQMSEFDLDKESYYYMSLPINWFKQLIEQLQVLNRTRTEQQATVSIWKSVKKNKSLQKRWSGKTAATELKTT